MTDTNNMSADEIRKKLELAIVEFLKSQVDNELMTPERQSEIAKWVLTLIRPGMSLEELYKAIPKLDDTCTELSPTILPFLEEYENGVTQKAEKKVSELIQEGHYAAASALADKVIKQEVKLVYYGKGTGKSTNSS